uniref:Uncharacterized protein n=1 Tax=Romanomermis culicivorax TaxID=13658 RepID=A0A915L9U5_ROMCU
PPPQPGSRSNSPSRIAAPTSSRRSGGGAGGGGRTPLTIAAPLQQNYFPVVLTSTSTREHSPTAARHNNGSVFVF